MTTLHIERKEWNRAAGVVLAAILLTCLPYGFGYLAESREARFTGLIYNPDDACVYLSWMRQAADGHFFFDNRFTTEPQLGRSVNLFFWLLGTAARWTHLPLIAVFHLSRIATGVILLLLIYRFLSLFVLSPFARRAALLLAAFSAGFGFFIRPGSSFIQRPVDAWQPEAITFLSLYLNPLFCISQILMLGGFYHLLLACRARSGRQAAYAGIWLFLLGNIHSYDIITVAAVWAAYLAVLAFRRRAIPLEALRYSLLAGLIAFPPTVYQYWLYRNEMVFQKRADVTTLSPALGWYLLGYGLLIPLAIYGIRLVSRRRLPDTPGDHPATSDSFLLAAWGVAGFAVPYLPFAFQRKMLMGLHIPLCILAAFALAALLHGLKRRDAILYALVALTASTNIFSLRRDILNIASNQTNTGIHRAFLSADEVEAMDWLEANTSRNDTVLSLPMIGVYIPAYAGNRVYVGHWGETADFSGKFNQVLRLLGQNTPDAERRAFMRRNHIAYLFHYNALPEMLPALTQGREQAFDPASLNYLEPAYRNEGVTVFRVR
ncbi:MAG: hypothetical protein IT210_18960 [Armatimonadetes bacterium]|nr:hypothetical protein [Armatimonadota bacterium]